MKVTFVNKEKILVVEDEPTISQLCERILTNEGFEVDIAINGKMAQEMVERKQYHLCLIDIRTPAMNGKELYRWLQVKHPQMTNQVIFTTGDVMGGDTQSFLEQSARPFLPKPFSPVELKTIMRETSKETRR